MEKPFPTHTAVGSGAGLFLETALWYGVNAEARGGNVTKLSPALAK